MDVPPSRYRVIERGRRLIVIDTHSGVAVGGLAPDQQQRIDRLVTALRAPEPSARPRADRQGMRPPSPAPRPSRAPSPSAPAPVSGETNILETQSWFDDKAPRRVRIAEGAQTGAGVAAIVALVFGITLFTIFGWPVAIILGLIAINLRKSIRAGITNWLDGLEQA